MLSFATEFPVKANSVSSLTDCVASWLKGSPHRNFSDDEIDALRGTDVGKIESGNQSIEVISTELGAKASRGCKHTVLDGGVLWTTTIVCSTDVEGSWVGIRTERVSIDPQIHLKPAKKPLLVRTVLKDMGGGLDGELYVSDAAYLIGDKDLHMTVRLLNGDSENYLPVIYISRCFDGSLPLNVAALSRSLGGLAHVLVEPSRSFSRLLQQETMSRNAYGGAIGIYLPTGARSLVFPDHFNEQEVRFRIVDTVQEALLGRRPLAQCTWYSLEAEKSRQEITRLRLQNSTDIDAFSQAFDTENSALRSELSAANAEILRMKIELNRSMQHQRDRFDVSSKIGIQEYFNGECEHFIFDALEAAISNVQEKSRRQEVLRQYLKNFSKSNELERRKGVLKSTLKDASGLDSDVAKSLENLGFSIDSSGKHHKIVYNGDESLTFTMSKTSSDWRSGLNLASDISKKIY